MQLKQMLSFGQSHPGRKGGKAGCLHAVVL